MVNARFAVTGGPGAGKTTVLAALAERAFAHVPESARAIIKSRLDQGLSPRPAAKEFGREILEMDIARYRATPVARQPVFFDRGVVDALSMLDETHSLSAVELAEQVEQFRFNEVAFLLPPWEAIYCTDGERDQTFSESARVFESLRNWYARWGYQTVEVPCLGVDARADFMVETAVAALASQRDRG